MTEDRSPFEQLVATTDDERVDPLFAARLRARVQRALGATPERLTIDLPARRGVVADVEMTPQATADPRTDRSTTMSQTTTSQVITPYICVHDASAALDWYREFFGAAISNVIPWEGRVGHAEVDVAGAVFYLSDEAPQLGVVAPARDGSQTSVSIVIQVAAVEQFVERAQRGGATVQRPIEEAHGSRSAWIVDPFGHRWNVGTPVYDAEQVAARRAPSEPYYMTLTTADVERGAAFYGAVLGWEFQEQGNGGRHVTNTEMPIGSAPHRERVRRHRTGRDPDVVHGARLRRRGRTCSRRRGHGRGTQQPGTPGGRRSARTTRASPSS
jgi:uncharacterized glyoxalase superfamily protein PhnB